MKVLIINGSPRKNGNTAIAVREMEQVFQQEGVEVETVQVGNQDVRGCIACGTCGKRGKCVFDDVVTTGKSYARFANLLEENGANVVGGMFLGKTFYKYK